MEGEQRVVRTVVVAMVALSLAMAILRRTPPALGVPQHGDVRGMMTKFSGLRAREHVLVLSNIFGERTVGSQVSDEETVAYIEGIAKDLQKVNGSRVVINVDVQTANGSVCFGALKAPDGRGGSVGRMPGRVNSYEGVRNVVVRVTRRDDPPPRAARAFLLSSHFDSAVSSPGASDDGVPVAVMLEALRGMVEGRIAAPKAPIVFLWNGAEETGLEGSHAFVTQHRFAATVTRFLNLESAGAGGRALLFRASRGVARAIMQEGRTPLGTSVAADVFASGLIPSDTDYRVFADVAGWKGGDLSLYRNGQVYHTAQDSYEHATAGSIQHMGDLVATAIEQADAIIDDDGSEGAEDTVYFDILGIWGIVLSGTVVRAFLVVSVAALVAGERPRVGAVALEVGAVAAALVAAMTAAALLTIFAPHARMFWYREPAGALALFGAAAVAALCAVRSLGPSAPTWLWAALGIALAWRGAASAYVPALVVAAAAIARSTARAGDAITRAAAGVVVFVASLHVAQVAVLVVDAVLPMLGRVPAHIPADIVAAAIAASAIVATAAAAAPLMDVMRVKRVGSSRSMSIALAALTLVLLVVAASRESESGFSSSAPRRILLHDVSTEDHRRILFCPLAAGPPIQPPKNVLGAPFRGPVAAEVAMGVPRAFKAKAMFSSLYPMSAICEAPYVAELRHSAQSESVQRNVRLDVKGVTRGGDTVKVELDVFSKGFPQFSLRTSEPVEMYRIQSDGTERRALEGFIIVHSCGYGFSCDRERITLTFRARGPVSFLLEASRLPQHDSPLLDLWEQLTKRHAPVAVETAIHHKTVRL